MELQLTDFENAAFSVFVVLVSRVMLAFNLNTYIPMSLVDENMRAAHRRSACRSERFWFRRHMDPSEIENADQWEDQYELMSLQQIMMGKGSYFPGLIPMVFAYLDALDEAGGGVDRETRNVVTNYMQFIQQRATGQLMTTAEWMRNFVTSHPDYKEDSVVTQRIAYDLMERCHHIGIGTCAISFNTYKKITTDVRKCSHLKYTILEHQRSNTNRYHDRAESFAFILQSRASGFG